MKNSILNFNEKLNKTTYNRHEFWRAYRNAVSSFIKSALKENHYKSLVIIGAGNLDDLDLDLFSENFEHITITDVDREALEGAKYRFRHLSSKLEIISVEYTGLGKSSEWDLFVKNIFISRSKSEIDAVFKKYRNIVKKNIWQIQGKYDMVIISPIYTQLLLHQALMNIDALESLNYPSQNLEYVRESVLDLVSLTIDTFNSNVLSIVKKNGLVAIMADIFETEKNTTFQNKAHDIYNNDIEMENFHKEYISKYGLGVGDYGLLNLSDQLNTLKSKWFEWPFDDKRIIYVKQEILSK